MLNQRQKAEEIILEGFLTEPFHNLYFKYNIVPTTYLYGGSCSDKVLSTYNKLKGEGFSVRLWSSLVKGLETHRLINISIDGKTYFADVGNAWPSVKMFPKDEEIEYESYGILFKSVINEDTLDIYNCRDDREILSVSVLLDSKPEEEIFKDIEDRFSIDIDYPFRDRIRFAQIIDEVFFFLRDEMLYVYSKKENYKINVSIDNEIDLKDVLMKYFGFDLDWIKK